MKPIAEMTDNSLKKMKPNEIYTFVDWWENILGLPELTHKKTYEYMKWATCSRGKVMQRINKELAARKKAERLIAIGNGKGLYLIDSQKLASFSVDKRVRGFIQKLETTMAEWNEIKLSEDLPPADKRMLNAAEGWLQVNENMMIGTLIKLPLLQDGTKNKLMKKLGIEPNRKGNKKPRGV